MHGLILKYVSVGSKILCIKLYSINPSFNKTLHCDQPKTFEHKLEKHMEDLYKGCPQIGVFTLQSNYILSSSSSIGSDFDFECPI